MFSKLKLLYLLTLQIKCAIILLIYNLTDGDKMKSMSVRITSAVIALIMIYGNTSDLAMIRECLIDAAEASKVGRKSVYGISSCALLPGKQRTF